MSDTKFCKHCGDIIDAECVVCPKCGKQVEQLETGSTASNIVINNNNENTNNNVNYASQDSRSSDKSKMIALILAIFLGGLGIHRFYVGKIGTGIIWFFTFGLFGIGWIYDVVKIATGTFRDGAGLIINR